MRSVIFKYWYYLLLFLGVISSCNKEGAGCFDKAGEVKTITIDVPPFTSLDVNSNIDVEFMADGIDRVELVIGENLIEGIRFELVEGVLKLNNLNTCFWSIGYTHPLIKIRNSSIEKIVQHGYGNIYSIDTLTIDKISLQVEDASGAIDLTLNANSINVVSNSIGPITLKGSTKNLIAGHYYSDGILYAKNLKAKNTSINHNGSNRMELNVLDKLTGSINSIGSVHLYGQEPASIIVDLTNRGEIINEF